MNILFICSKNKWRSRTAETIFKNHKDHNVKSAGTDEGSKVKLNEKHLKWAELIFVMEDKHRQIIKQRFQFENLSHKILVLDIPDDYKYMDEELISTLKVSINPYLENVIEK